VEREEDGRRRLDAVEMEDGGERGGGGECDAGEWHGKERGRDEEEGCQERQFGGRCGHRGCGDKKKLRNKARRKRTAFVIYF
jgi:hypothetical protein